MLLELANGTLQFSIPKDVSRDVEFQKFTVSLSLTFLKFIKRFLYSCLAKIFTGFLVTIRSKAIVLRKEHGI